MNMLMVLSFTFQQCLGAFTMLPVKNPSEMGRSRQLSNHVLLSEYFRKYMSYEGHLFLERFKI